MNHDDNSHANSWGIYHRTPQPQNIGDAAIHILWLVQAVCWLLVLL
jgi:hypothetical protein